MAELGVTWGQVQEYEVAEVPSTVATAIFQKMSAYVQISGDSTYLSKAPC